MGETERRIIADGIERIKGGISGVLPFPRVPFLISRLGLMGDFEMIMRLLIILLLVAVAISGCMEKGPGGPDGRGTNISVSGIKALSIQSADGLSSYRLKTTTTENTIVDPFQIDVSPRVHGLGTGSLQIVWKGRVTNETAEIDTDMDLSGHRASIKGTATSTVKAEDQPEETKIVQTDIYQIGNITYLKMDGGNWTGIISPLPSESLWEHERNNHILAMAESINSSQVEVIGIEMVDGNETYKLEILATDSDYENLYTAAHGLADQLTQYPQFMPSIKRSEFNESVVTEKQIWISKETYLPVKYQSKMGFKLTPYIIGALDPDTSLMKMFNQSVRLGEVSVITETTEIYYDFNRSMEISPPKEALQALAGK